MRALWCFLVVMSLLAPLGSAGITISPQDASSQITTPRSGADTLASARRDGLEPAPLAMPVATVVTVESPVVWTPVPALVDTSSTLVTRHVPRPLGSRAPPA